LVFGCRDLNYLKGSNSDQLLEVMGKSGANPLLSRNCDVLRFIDTSQNARLLSQFDEDRPLNFHYLVR